MAPTSSKMAPTSSKMAPTSSKMAPTSSKMAATSSKMAPTSSKMAPTSSKMAAPASTMLVTGGAGFIGSHCCLMLLEQGYQVVVVDNLINSMSASLGRVCDVIGINKDGGEFDDNINKNNNDNNKGEKSNRLVFYKCDVGDKEKMRQVFKKHRPVSCVFHFAGLKSVISSMDRPLDYYDNNVSGTTRLLQVMREAQVYRLVFSSSSTVYGEAGSSPMNESHETGATKSTYGRTKHYIEQILHDVAKYEKNRLWRITILRYFNPIGCHPSGRVGEHGTTMSTNLIPYLCHVAAGTKDRLPICGGDYNTEDGTAVRDYVHVMDLCRGHILAMQHLFSDKADDYQIFNLGANAPQSVLQMHHAFERASGKTIPYDIKGRRPGDVEKTWCDATLACNTLGWRPTMTMEQMCTDAWRFKCMNPNGYSDDKPFKEQLLVSRQDKEWNDE